MPRENYELVIGLEVHCQLQTVSKMFSDCTFEFGAEPNLHIDPYTLALPGSLPVPNAQAVDFAVKLALALGCEIQMESRWARKHYFYPDLPKGYQITQAELPYARGGSLLIPVKGAGEVARRIALTRIHMEEDAGKNIHLAGENRSLLDFNRAGAPLVEVVSEAEIRSAKEAANYLRELRSIIRCLKISEANMEEGSLRCDANVSLRRLGATTLGTRCEIKNLNSFKHLESAIEAECRRQVDLLDAGEEVVQGTMAYDVEQDRTWMMRSKESAADYRYLPEPDLPPLQLEASRVDALRQSLPELPQARMTRYLAAGLGNKDAEVLSADLGLADYFEGVLCDSLPIQLVCNWVRGELLAQLHRDGKEVATSPLAPQALQELLCLIETGTLSNTSAKYVFKRMYHEEVSARELVRQENLQQIVDPDELARLVQESFARYPQQCAQLRAGKTKLRGFFFGKCMEESRRRADPKLLNQQLDLQLIST